MSFKQTNPERVVSIFEICHNAFDEFLLRGIFNASQHSTLKRKHRLFVTMLKTHIRPNLNTTYLLYSDSKIVTKYSACILPCLTQLLAASAHSISSWINK